MRSSDIITAFIMSLLNDGDGNTEIKRNELAQRFNVVPSQINYVISSRFTPEMGFITESRRGGGGYIRIRRAHSGKALTLMHIINSIGESLSPLDCRVLLDNLAQNGYVSAEAFRLMTVATGEQSYSCVPPESRDRLRACVLKNMLLSLAVRN